jgi:cytochrome c-type biogenesis protein CcmH/NrfF
MPIVWLIPITLVLAGAGVFAVARRRKRNRVSFTQEPVSGQWLAEARSREEQHW